MEKNKLRIALFLKSNIVEAWKYYAVGEIMKSNVAEIALIGKYQSAQPFKKTSLPLLYKTYERLEKLKWKGPAKALEPKDITNLLEEKPRFVTLNLEKNNRDFRLKQDGSQILSNANLDVIYLLDYIPLQLESENLATYGIWYNHFGLAGNRLESPVGFWEFLHNLPFISSSLRGFQNNPDQEQVYYESKGPSDRFSIGRTKESCFWKSAKFITRKLLDISLKNELISIKKTSTDEYQNKYKIPGIIDLIRLNKTFVIRYISEKLINRVYSQQWGLLFHFNFQEFLSTKDLTPLLPPKNKFWADPFIYHKNDQHFIFLEESYLGKKKKGFISVMEIDSEGTVSNTQKIIEQPYHLSYPFIFQWQDKQYMIPESNQNYTIQLYECKDFPYRWEFVKNLQENIAAVDTTLFFHNNIWWIFTNIKEHKNASLWDELFLFFTDDPLSSNWTPHPCNPIVSDVTKARPAGQIFKIDNKIFRPAQNCSYRYGYGLSLQEITDLTEDSYKEIEHASYTPKDLKKVNGLHTYNQSKRFTVIDAVIRRNKLLP